MECRDVAIDLIRHVPAAVLTHGRWTATAPAVNGAAPSTHRGQAGLNVRRYLHRILPTTAGADGGLGRILSDIGTFVPAR